MSDEPTKQKFEDLTRDVDWQLNSLLSYIMKGFRISLKARAKMSPSELVVQNVLEAYLMLAKKFYAQFKAQLKKAYYQKTGNNAAKDNVSEADVSVLLQKALDKLTAEWERVYGFIAATEAKKTSETQEVITKLSPLIRAAVSDVGFSPESLPVIPQFGSAYSLGFFNYTDDFMALNLPITALQSPWEWTIFWHEIAGQKLRLLKKTQLEFLNVLGEFSGEMKRWQQQNLVKQEDLRMTTRANLDLVLSLTIPATQLNTLQEEQKDDFLEVLTDCLYEDWNSPDSLSSSFNATRKFIHDLSPLQRERGFPILMFSFDDLLENVMEELRLQQKKSVMDNLQNAHKKSLTINKIGPDETDSVMKNLFESWEKALSLEETLAAQKKALTEEGWSVDWLEELFEDSFSALNFDVNFLPIFDRLLRRHTDGGKDMRHPPHHVRLATAAVLKLLDCDETLLQQDLPPKADEFPSGLNSKEKEILKRFYPGPLSADAQAVVWLVVKKFHEMHKRVRIPYDDPEGAIRKAKDAIADAMETHIDNLNTSEEIANIAAGILASLAGTVSNLMNSSLDDISTVQNKFAVARGNYTKKIDTLLKTRNIIPPQLPLGHRELLGISFYDVDFGNETYTNIRSPWRNYTSATLSGPPIEVENGTVLYIDSRQKEHKTNRQFWNDKAAGFQL